MGVILAFFIGYVLGTRAGREGMEELIDSVEQIARSEEVRGLITMGAALLGIPLREVLLPTDPRGSRATSAGSMAEFAMGMISNFNRRVA
jgi:hypothetical protein